MNIPRLISRRLRQLSLAPALLAAAVSSAQQNAAPATPTPDAKTLARYDKNQNGRLDPDELAAKEVDDVRAGVVPVAGAAKSEVVEMSPFQVAASDQGYYASNTLSGTRISSKLEDLGASISVVTKQQMQDFALLDINDVFLYEANTEGTGNYTDVVVDRNGNVIDNVAGNPNNANRVRGIGPANQSFGNYETSGRVPIDAANIDGMEISRGPNSNIFGLGSGSGTVNAIPAQASPTREFTSVELRTDDLGSFRSVLDVNRPIIRGKLGIRGTMVYQEDEFVRQPAFSRTNRYNGMITYKPFKNTTLRATYEHYENYARRPNSILPRDGVTYWQQNGRPTWDPSTWTVTRNGVKTVVPYSTTVATENAGFGPGLESIGTNLARSLVFVDRGQVGLWTTGYISGIPAPTTANPNPIPTPDFHPTSGHQRFIQTAPAPRAGPLAPAAVSITDRSIYDWTEVNIAAANWNQDKVDTYTAELEQIIINTPRHVLAAQLGFRREDSKRYTRSFIGTGGESPMVVYIDVSEKLLDGAPNPYFLKPYINATEPTISRQPEIRDTSRGQLAYKLNLAQEKNWTRWLGDHAFSGYAEYKDRIWANYRFKDAIIDDHTWLPAGSVRGAGATVARSYYRYYLGDNQGQNIDYGSPAWDKFSGKHDFRWFDAGLNQWVNEPATVGEAFVPSTARQENLIRTYGGVMQNHVLSDRIVTTFGWRKDSNFNRNFANTTVNPDGITPNYASDDTSPNNWFRRDGRTETSGVVVKPFRGWGFIDRQAEKHGAFGYVGEFIRSLNFHYNRADSFIPATIAQNLNLKLLPNPSSEGRDFGVSFSLFNKLVVRFNTYETTQVNSRTGDAGTIATRAGRLDFAFGGNNDQFNLQRQATAWITAGNPTLSTEQLDAEVAKVMGVTVGQLALMNAYPIAETSDVVSKGREIEITYNPSRYWTTKVNIANQEVVEENVTPGIQDYIDNRRPFWETIIDPRTNTPWFSTRYGSAGTAVDFLNGSVLAPYKLLRANEGKSRPQIRQWRVNALSNFQLAGLGFENKWLRNTAISGAVRWEDKASIGYFAYDNDPNAYDPNRVIYDKARTYLDLGASYSTKIYRNKIGLRVQLNVRNAFEKGRLQPVNALPNGVPYNLRIIDPQLFVLTTTFTL